MTKGTRTGHGPASMLVVASATEHRDSLARVWGSGGPLAPEAREALDWATLARLHGWPVAVSPPDGPFPAPARWTIVACDPGELDDGALTALLRPLAAEPVLLVTRPAPADHPLAGVAGATVGDTEHFGSELRWRGPGEPESWFAWADLATCLEPTAEDTQVWATLNGAPAITARACGRGTVVTLGFHPSVARDLDGTVTAMLRRLLIAGSGAPVAWLDLEGTLVLRMDDPGGAQNVHSSEWRYSKLEERAWASIAEDLRTRGARLSVCYTPGWVDDGDGDRGALTVDGGDAPRRAGAVWPSARVRYQAADGCVSDYQAEWRGIQALRSARLGDVELHGHTHMDPDLEAWAVARDRYDNVAWYREFGHAQAGSIGRGSSDHHPLELGLTALREAFDTLPTTLVPPGHECTNETVELAGRRGLSFISSERLALGVNGSFWWCHHVLVPYLDGPESYWLRPGLPVVGFFHDHDLATHGTSWMSTHLDGWQAVGMRRIVDFRELAAILARSVSVRTEADRVRVVVDDFGAPPLPRPLPLGVYLPESERGRSVTVMGNGWELDAETGVDGPAIRVEVGRDLPAVQA
jgi:hypothetical protein